LIRCRQYIVGPLEDGLSQANEMLEWASSPEFKVPIKEPNSMWMMTTYLDDTLRISRDDEGATFIMLKG
jgi:hypothetical protein